MEKMTTEEFNILLTQNPTNEDLKYIIEYTEFKIENRKKEICLKERIELNRPNGIGL